MAKTRLGRLDEKSTLGTGCQLYKESNVQNSTLGTQVVVGDFSRVIDTTLEDLVKIDRNNLIQRSEVGRLSYTGNFTVIQKAHIGSFCSIAWGVTIGGGEHDTGRLTTHDFLYNDRYGLGRAADLHYDRYASACEIGHDVWIGAKATILRGVRVGNGAVIGANSLVSRDIPDYAIAVGNPARVVRYRFEPQIIRRIIGLEWWKWDLADIAQFLPAFSSENAEDALAILEKK